jgi:hypothetical protein
MAEAQGAPIEVVEAITDTCGVIEESLRRSLPAKVHEFWRGVHTGFFFRRAGLTMELPITARDPPMPGGRLREIDIRLCEYFSPMSVLFLDGDI